MLAITLQYRLPIEEEEQLFFVDAKVYTYRNKTESARQALLTQ